MDSRQEWLWAFFKKLLEIATALQFSGFIPWFVLRLLLVTSGEHIECGKLDIGLSPARKVPSLHCLYFLQDFLKINIRASANRDCPVSLSLAMSVLRTVSGTHANCCQFKIPQVAQVTEPENLFIPFSCLLGHVLTLSTSKGQLPFSWCVWKQVCFKQLMTGKQRVWGCWPETLSFLQIVLI